MSFPGRIEGRNGDQFRNSVGAEKLLLGTIMEFPDGREFVFARAGATQLEVARLMQQAVVVSGHEVDLAVAVAAAIGDVTVTLTNSTTAITLDEYAQGYLIVNDAGADAGDGQYFKIKSHPAESTGSGSIVITLEDEDGLRVALTTNAQCGLRRHPCDDVLVAPTTFTGALVGVTQNVVTAANFCWLQTKRTTSLLTNGTVIVGLHVTRSATTPGACDVYPLNSVDGSGQQPMVGDVESVGATTEFSLVNLKL